MEGAKAVHPDVIERSRLCDPFDWQLTHELTAERTSQTLTRVAFLDHVIHQTFAPYDGNPSLVNLRLCDYSTLVWRGVVDEHYETSSDHAGVFKDDGVFDLEL